MLTTLNELLALANIGRKSAINSSTYSIKQLEDSLNNPTFVDYLNVFLCLPVLPQKILYKSKEKTFEFDPAINTKKYRIDRESLLAWVIDNRLGAFLKSELFHECQLCIELTSVSKSVDNQLVDLLTETLGHVAGMRHFVCTMAGSAGEIIYNLWMDLARFVDVPHRNMHMRWRMFREIQLQYFCIDQAYDTMKKAIPTILQEGIGTSNAQLWQSMGQVFSSDQLPSEVTCNTLDIINLDTFQCSAQSWQHQLVDILRITWLPRYLNHISIQRQTIGQHRLPYADICGCVAYRPSVENVEETMVLAQDVEQACVGMGVIESRPPTLRTNRYSPHDESILAAKVPCAKSAAEMMDNLAKEATTSFSAMSIASTAAIRHIFPDFVELTTEELSSSNSKSVTGCRRIENIFLKQSLQAQVDTNSSHHSSCTDKRRSSTASTDSLMSEAKFAQSYNGFRVTDQSNARERPLWATTIDFSKRRRSRELFRALFVDRIGGAVFYEYLGKTLDEESLTLMDMWNDIQWILCASQNAGRSNAPNYVRFWRLKLLTAQMIDMSQRVGFDVSTLLSEIKEDDSCYSHMFFWQDLIAEKLYQQWREYCRNDIRHFTHTVLCHRSATAAWDEEVARTESADAKLKDAKNTFEASLVKRTRDDFGLVRAKERSRKALLLALKIGRMYEGDVMMGSSESRSLDVTFYNVDMYGSLAEPVESTAYSRYDLEQAKHIKRTLSRLLTARGKQESLRFSSMYTHHRHSAPASEMDDASDNSVLQMDPEALADREPRKPDNFEGLISNFVQLEFFRRYLRAVRAIRPLNFYLAVAEMKKCHTQRRRLEKLDEILQNFFHISQDKTEEMLRLDHGKLDGMGLFENRKITAAMVEGVQRHVGAALREKWFPMYQETFVKTEKGETKQVIPVAMEKPRTDRRKKSSTKSTGSGGGVSFLETSHLLWKRVISDLLSFRRCINQLPQLQAFQKYLARRRIRSRVATAEVAANPDNVVVSEEVTKDAFGRVFSPDIRKYEDDIYFVIEAERYAQFWDEWSAVRKQGTGSSFEFDQLHRKAKIIIERFLEFQKVLTVQVNVPTDIGQAVVKRYYTDRQPERGLFSDIYLTLFPIVFRQWKRHTHELYMNKYKSVKDGDSNNSIGPALAKNDEPHVSVIVTHKYPSDVMYSDEVSTVHYGFSLGIGATLTLPTKAAKSSKAAVSDDRLASLLQRNLLGERTQSKILMSRVQEESKRGSKFSAGNRKHSFTSNQRLSETDLHLPAFSVETVRRISEVSQSDWVGFHKSQPCVELPTVDDLASLDGSEGKLDMVSERGGVTASHVRAVEKIMHHFAEGGNNKRPSIGNKTHRNGRRQSQVSQKNAVIRHSEWGSLTAAKKTDVFSTADTVAKGEQAYKSAVFQLPKISKK